MRIPSELPHPADDRRLLDAAVGGDLDAFTALFDRYRSMLLGRCVRELRDIREAEDVVQDTFIRAAANLGRFDPRRPLWPWLATIAHRMCVDILRRRGRASLVEEPSDGTERCDPRELSGTHIDDMTFEEVCARETRDLLARAIGQLPPRQRRTLLLRELEGWDYADIAAAEATTVSSVKALLFRARSRLREAYATMGALGLVAILVRPLRRARERLRTSMVHLEGPSTAAMAQVASGVVALALVVGAASPVPSDAARGITRAAAGPSITPTGASDPVAAAAERRAGKEAVTEPAADLIEDLTDPNADVKQPEDAQIRSFASAGDTVFAVGVTHCRGGVCPAVLFRSDDAGGSWKRLAAEGLKADQILLSPGFGSTDARIFAMGATGLQVSRDGGETFTSVVPAAGRAVVGSAAISPAFGAGDPRILIGGQNLMEYRDDVGAFQPSAALALPGPLEPAFAPDYPADDRIVVGGRDVDPETGMLVPAVFVCSSAACTRAPLEGYPLPPKVRLSEDVSAGRVAAFTPDDIFVSNEKGQGFRSLPAAWERADVTDVLLGARTIYAGVLDHYGSQGNGGLYRSLDHGASWERLRHAKLQQGIRAIHEADSVMIVALSNTGVLCSADGGSTWRVRC